jgi:hypothetical protein
MLTKPIPIKQRNEMSEDPFMKRCCIRDENCDGRINWHHHQKYCGRRISDKFSILPVCEFHHRWEAGYKDKLNWIMINRMTKEDFEKYPKIKWSVLKSYLKKKYG